MVELFVNSGDPDQMPHSVVSDLGLHCLPVTCLGVSSLQWVNRDKYIFGSNFYPFRVDTFSERASCPGKQTISNKSCLPCYKWLIFYHK